MGRRVLLFWSFKKSFCAFGREKAERTTFFDNVFLAFFFSPVKRASPSKRTFRSFFLSHSCTKITLHFSQRLYKWTFLCRTVDSDSKLDDILRVRSVCDLLAAVLRAEVSIEASLWDAIVCSLSSWIETIEETLRSEAGISLQVRTEQRPKLLSRLSLRGWKRYECFMRQSTASRGF